MCLDKSDNRKELTRRELLERGARLAGAFWVIPAVKVVDLQLSVSEVSGEEPDGAPEWWLAWGYEWPPTGPKPPWHPGKPPWAPGPPPWTPGPPPDWLRPWLGNG